MTRLVGGLALLVLACALCLGLWFGYRAWTQHQHDAQVHADVGAAAASIKSGAAAGHDAVELVQSEAQAEAANAALTQRNTHDIENAPGAEAPVDPRVYVAALRAHCLRHSSRDDPACFVMRHPGS